jgi:NAD(P)-dependent dehydrogenase (short-subunit alcohol dehydrogenase family)
MASGAPQTALVTGGARRIGRAVALALARDGWAVAIHYHTSAAGAQQIVGEIAARGGRAHALQADLACESDVAPLLGRAAAALGPVALLVNNAAAFAMDRVESVTRASWDLHLETNLRAPFVLSQQFAAALPGGVPGNIVNVLDQRVWNPTPLFVSYTVSKAGLWMLTRTLALALAPRIRVNAIGPGPTLRSDHQTAEHFERQVQGTPLQRAATPEEIADAVRFIVAAPSMTGQMIALDGGQHLNWHGPPSGASAPP